MNTHTEKTQKSKSQTVADGTSQLQTSSKSALQFVDNRPETVAQRKLQEMLINASTPIQRIGTPTSQEQPPPPMPSSSSSSRSSSSQSSRSSEGKAHAAESSNAASGETTTYEATHVEHLNWGSENVSRDRQPVNAGGGKEEQAEVQAAGKRLFGGKCAQGYRWIKAKDAEGNEVWQCAGYDGTGGEHFMSVDLQKGCDIKDVRTWEKKNLSLPPEVANTAKVAGLKVQRFLQQQ